MSKKRAKHSKAACGECYYDYVSISYGSVEEKYCGDDIPGPIISSGNTMTVVFVCDSLFQFTGFKATWEAVDGDSDGGDSDGGDIGGGGSGEDSGEIQTPNYPDFYPASSNEVISAKMLAQPLTMLPYILLGVEPGG